MKYLFSGINRGIPEYYGCMHRIMKWLRSMLLSYGIISLFQGIIEIILILVSLKTAGYEQIEKLREAA